jgi:hypothetical protein
VQLLPSTLEHHDVCCVLHQRVPARRRSSPATAWGVYSMIP